MKKVVKTKAFKDKLKGHKDGILNLNAPDGPNSGVLYSVSNDGCVRCNHDNNNYYNKIYFKIKPKNFQIYKNKTKQKSLGSY